TARELVWQQLKSPSSGNIDAFTNFLEGLENEMISKTRVIAPLLMPKWHLSQPNQTATMPIWLYGALDVNVLTGKLVVAGDGVTINKLTGTPDLKAAGWRVLPEVEDKQVKFRCERESGAAALPQGPLMQVEFKLGAAGGAAYPVNLLAVETQ